MNIIIGLGVVSVYWIATTVADFVKNGKQNGGEALTVGGFKECVTSVNGDRTCETSTPYTVSYPNGRNPVFTETSNFQVPFELLIQNAMGYYRKAGTQFNLETAYNDFNSAHKQSLKDKTKVFSDAELLAFNEVANKLNKPINHGATNARIRDLLNAEEVAHGKAPTHSGRNMQKPNNF